MSYHIQLPRFEGPLDLLLYLIRKEEMNIMEIEIHKITAQYLEFIQLMKELDLEVAGEFVAMAATLLQIKSKLLLPTYNEAGEIIETEDPRKELVQRLLEYEKYKEAAKALLDRPWLGRDIWTRGVREKLGEVEEEIVLEDNALFSLIAMYRGVLRLAKKKVHQVSAKTQSIASRIMELKKYLIVGEKVSFFSIIEGAEDMLRQKLITFLSLLELGKLGFATLYQTDVYQDIWVETTKPIENDVVSSVEEYDKIHSSETADELFAKAEAKQHAATDKVAHDESEAEEFIMKDSFREETEEEESLFSTEEIASDEDILQAERELKEDAQGIRSENLATRNETVEAHEEAAFDDSQTVELETEALPAENQFIDENQLDEIQLTEAQPEEMEIAESITETAESEEIQAVEAAALDLPSDEDQSAEPQAALATDDNEIPAEQSEVALSQAPEFETAPVEQVPEEKTIPAAVPKKPDVVRLAESASKAFEAFFSEPAKPAPENKIENKLKNKTDDSESSGEANV